MKKLFIFSQIALFTLLSCLMPDAKEESVLNRYSEYTIIVYQPDNGGRIEPSSIKAFAGQRIVITAFPDPLPEGAGKDALPWRVAEIRALTTTDEGEKTLVVARKPSLENTYQFTMPSADVELRAEFTQEAASAKTGVVRVLLDYMDLTDGVEEYYIQHVFEPKEDESNYYYIQLRHGSGKVIIYAETEDVNATASLEAAESTDFKALEGTEEDEGIFYHAVSLPIGRSKFTLTISSADGNHEKQYTLEVNQEPDLSLTLIQLKNGNTTIKSNFDLLLDGETVSGVPYSDPPYTLSAYTGKVDVNVTIAVDPPTGNSTTGTGRVVNFPLSSTTCTALITVSKTVSDEPYKREYSVHVEIVGSGPVPGPSSAPETVGGSEVILAGGTRVHWFINTGEHPFYTPDNLTGIRILLVGGGGGGGGGGYDQPSSGGGAGGVVLHDNWPLSAGSYTVVVGAGGAGGTVAADGYAGTGASGNDSAFGSMSLSPDFIAYGGGGGGAPQLAGTRGGSWGGGTLTVSLDSLSIVLGGTFAADGAAYGNIGGTASADDSGNGDYAGGGGGADGPGEWILAGTDGSPLSQGGGKGTLSNITGALQTYSTGGDVPYGSTSAGSDGAANTGNGGQGAWGAYSGGSGGVGIVIISVPPVATPIPE